MDALSAFGLVAVTLMVVFYACEKRSPWCILGFAAACLLGSVYGFCKGLGHSGWWRQSGPRSPRIAGVAPGRGARAGLSLPATTFDAR